MNKSELKNIAEGLIETFNVAGQESIDLYSKDDYGDKLLGGGWIYKTVNKNLST